METTRPCHLTGLPRRRTDPSTRRQVIKSTGQGRETAPLLKHHLHLALLNRPAGLHSTPPKTPRGCLCKTTSEGRPRAQLSGITRGTDGGAAGQRHPREERCTWYRPQPDASPPGEERPLTPALSVAVSSQPDLGSAHLGSRLPPRDCCFSPRSRVAYPREEKASHNLQALHSLVH